MPDPASTDPVTGPPAADRPARPLGPALARALRGQCPACGEARLFARFLKPVTRCPHCGQCWDLHSADDFPAYIVIILLGHILLPLMIEVNAALSVPLAVQAVLWPLLALILAIAMIQPAKAAVITYQWSRRMQGFR
ncbi:MAG: DUF983 domain-containing protein [Sphingobium sp.]